MSRKFIGCTFWWLFVLGFGCESFKFSNKVPDSVRTPKCKAWPTIKYYQDTLTYINELRRFVAKTADFGNVENEFCKNYNENLETFGVDTFLNLFDADIGKSSCGLNAMIMVQILLENGIAAYAYNFGFEGTSLTHVVVLVKYNNKLLIFDPYLNYAMLKTDGTNMDIITLIAMVGSGNLTFQTTKDTVVADLLIDENILNKTPEFRDSIMEIPSCRKLLKSASTTNRQVKKVEFQRCYECELNRECFNLIRQFELGLNQQTGLRTYHESMVLKIGNVWGAYDSPYIDELIESAIYNQPYMAEKINGRIR